MKTTYLVFEQPIGELEARIEELRFVQDDSAVDISEEIGRLEQKNYGLTKDIYGKLTPWQCAHRVRRHDKTVSVSVPQDEDEIEVKTTTAVPEVRESIKIEALLARIGTKMGMQIWIPRNDRNAIVGELNTENIEILQQLPLNYDETTLKTIEQIDVLWLRRRSIIRAFEVEHTTSIYSGILRMADLLALQPNMDIKLHIVAPDDRREKVFREIRLPVFSLLEKGPLAENCTYLRIGPFDGPTTESHRLCRGIVTPI